MSKVNIGMKQARRLAELSAKDRWKFLAEGLPLIHDSSFGFWSAANALLEQPRESEVLKGFAEEEAAKALILMDIVRCPSALLSERMRPVLGWFYNHLARLIYAKAADWNPENTRQLQEYIDNSRKAHELEGYAGEYIVPNWEEYRRESQLYVDIAAFEDGQPIWSSPIVYPSHWFVNLRPTALNVLDALHQLGLTTEAGLKTTAEIWGQVTFQSSEGYRETERLTQELVERAIAEQLPLETAENHHVQTLYEGWQIPMYLLDLRKIDVPMDELQGQRDAMLWAEIGY